MNEQQLRQKVADTINAWVGSTRGSAGHREILQIYNGHTPLARGYRVQQGDAYCATTVSATWIKAGIAAYTGTECGVGQFVEIAKGKGIWVENDAYTPKIGDAVCYDWQDSGAGDNLGWPDHIGIVTAVTGSTFTVTEGNISGGTVGKRTMMVNGKYIRGYICPKYAEIAKALTPKEEKPWYEADGSWERGTALGLVDGKRPTDKLTRAEGNVMMLRAMELMKEGKA